MERLDFCAVLGTNTGGLHITLAIPNSFFRENINVKKQSAKRALMFIDVSSTNCSLSKCYTSSNDCLRLGHENESFMTFILHCAHLALSLHSNNNIQRKMAQEDVFKKIVSHCKEYGFVFPSSDIYDGLGAVYDYGQNGVELKNNIKQYWWQSMVLLHENIVGIDSAIFMHPTVWKASGHVDAFNDPLIDNRDSKKRYRADVLIEDQIAKYEEKIEKEVAKARKRFGDSFDEEKFRATNPRVIEHQQKRDALHERYSEAMNKMDLNELKQIILSLIHI